MASSTAADPLPKMPKLYEYFGLIIIFYANEHDPVHVHGKCQGRETRAELVIIDGLVSEDTISASVGKAAAIR